MLLFADSFDHYATADITEKHQDDGNGGITTNGSGRCDTEAYFNNTIGAALITGVTNSGNWGLVGAAFKPAQLTNQGFITIGNGSNVAMGFLVTQADGAIALWSGPSKALGTEEAVSVAGLLNVGIWSYIEFRFNFTDGGGALYGYHNGSLVVSATGLNPGIWAGNAPWRTINIITGGGTGNRVDDLYIANSGGSVDASVSNLGDTHVEYLPAEADSVAGGGTYAQWTPSTGVDHGAMVDETPPDDDTTTLSAATAGFRDTETLPDISISGGTIHGLQVIVSVKKDNATLGNRTIKTVIVSGVTTDEGDEQAISTDYKFYRQIYETDPNTASAWLIAGVNALEAGVRLES